MDFDLYKKIIDEAAGHVYDINLAHRGESTFHKGLPEMIQLCFRKRDQNTATYERYYPE